MHGGIVCSNIKDPDRSRLDFAKCRAFLENDTDNEFLSNLENGATVRYIGDLERRPDVPEDENNESKSKHEGFYVITKLS